MPDPIINDPRKPKPAVVDPNEPIDPNPQIPPVEDDEDGYEENEGK